MKPILASLSSVFDGNSIFPIQLRRVWRYLLVGELGCPLFDRLLLFA
jgi:hypothetical protein